VVDAGRCRGGLQCGDLAPYLVKRLIDAISAYTLQITQIGSGAEHLSRVMRWQCELASEWLPGRADHHHDQAECYRLFMRYLGGRGFNDEPGLIVIMRVLIVSPRRRSCSGCVERKSDDPPVVGSRWCSR